MSRKPSSAGQSSATSSGGTIARRGPEERCMPCQSQVARRIGKRPKPSSRRHPPPSHEGLTAVSVSNIFPPCIRPMKITPSGPHDRKRNPGRSRIEVEIADLMDDVDHPLRECHHVRRLECLSPRPRVDVAADRSDRCDLPDTPRSSAAARNDPRRATASTASSPFSPLSIIPILSSTDADLS